jgi:hypothetical protein
MKLTALLFAVTIIALFAFTKDSTVKLDKGEAKKAFVYLNNVRSHPEKYYTEYSFLKSSKISNTTLIWNDTLAKVAEAKALDMANRNYLDHVDPEGYGMNYYINKSKYSLDPEWLTTNSANFFESIAGGAADGETAIQLLIIDDGIPALGHRKHLLGMGLWNASLVDIGIGYAKRDTGSEYTSYMSILIAKHSW